MKKLIIITLILSLFLSGCTSGNNINNKEYPTYGLFNKESRYDSKILYEISAQNVIVGIIFCGTVFVPVYVIGWSLFEPVKVRTSK